MCMLFRFVEYKPTSLERSYKYDLLTEHDLGVNIDLINPDTYRIEPGGALTLQYDKHCKSYSKDVNIIFVNFTVPSCVHLLEYTCRVLY